METLIRLFVKVAGIIGAAFLMAFPTMWLWDWLAPEIFNLTEITFWQALGINLLCRILFKK